MAIRLSSENKGSVNMELCKTALAARYAQEAKTASERAQAATVHPPVIGGNGNWQIWDQGSGAYVDSGLRAAGPAGEQGPQGEAGNYTKPAAGIPEEDLSQAVRNKLNSGGASDYADLNNKPGINGVTLSGNKTAAQLGLAAADDVPTKTSQLQNDVGFLTQHQSLAAYRTAAAQDMIDAGKQAKIAASGMLKGDGNGGVTAATAGTDYQAPLIAGTDYETPAGAKALGLTGTSAGDLVRVNAVDANGKPTSWRKAPLCEIKTQKNLLINSYFKNAVNQLGQSSYTNVGMTIDRWRLTNGSVSIGPNGLTLNGTIEQTLEFSIGQPVTCSALLSDGSLITPTYNESSKTFVLTAAGQTIVAAKLELGPEQTLAHKEGTEANPVWVLNEIPDYTDELSKCQRFLLNLNMDGREYTTCGFAYAAGTTNINVIVSLPTTMKSWPDVVLIKNEIMFQVGSRYYTASNPIIYVYNISSGSMQINISGFSGLTTGNYGICYFQDYGTIVFECE